MCRVVTYWCMIGTIGVSAPTIAERRGAHWPAALRTIAVCTVPLSVSTCVTAPAPSRLMPVTRQFVSMATPSSRARLANSSVMPLGSIQPSSGMCTAPSMPSGLMNGAMSSASLAEMVPTSRPSPRARLTCRCNALSRFGLEARRRLPTLCQPMLLAPSALNWS